MKVGLLVLFEGRASGSDSDMFQQELALALDAEKLGFDRVMAVEHHFTDYAMCPDNAQLLSYVAARTSTIELMPSAFILPWHDPIRVAEKIVMLDQVSGGRAVLGMGRGLARREFEAFRVEMAESRERYDESAEMILEALDTGFMEGDGPFYRQPRTEIRPRPSKSFKGRSYMVGGSPGSMLTAAKLGLGVMQFGTPATQESVDALAPYRSAFAQQQGTPAPPMITADLMVCDRDGALAERYARKYQAEYWFAVMNHYELLGHHFAEAGGTYDTYAELAESLREDTPAVVDAYIDANLWGDPAQIIEQLRRKYETFGGVDLALMASYSDMPYELVRSSLELFSKEVLPEVQSWAPIPVQAGATN